MHGLGNDFVIFDDRVEKIQLSPRLIKKVADRRLGVGCDQVLLMTTPKNGEADVRMDIFNADGSPAGACGNGTRCVAWLEFIARNKKDIRIETADRIVEAHVHAQDEVTVDMGRAKCQDFDFMPGDVEEAYTAYVGNPHVVIFPKKDSAIQLEQTALSLQENLLFPQGTNVEFVHVVNRSTLKMDVWERGVGYTAACGTGACAVAVAAHTAGRVDATCQVKMPGGKLKIDICDDSTIKMTGSVCLSFKGTLDESLSE